MNRIAYHLLYNPACHLSVTRIHTHHIISNTYFYPVSFLYLVWSGLKFGTLMTLSLQIDVQTLVSPMYITVTVWDQFLLHLLL